jgi:serine protease Do
MHRVSRLPLVCSVLALVLLGGHAAFAQGAGLSGPQASSLKRVQTLPSGCPASVPVLYDRTSPAVVSINAESIDPYDQMERLKRVSGSGVIIDAGGLILTNSHVVFGRQVITVTLDEGVTLPAKLIGADPLFDIALLRIPTPKSGTLPVLQLGDSSQVDVGDDVFAIGNPLGLDQTLTRGLVSAVNRTLPGTAWSLTEPMIQTDAAINPGNSGGALVDACGRIVGITTAILPGAQGIGFAVPADLIKEVIPSLLKSGRLIRPWLGVQGQFVAPSLKELLRLPLVDGFLVEAVEPGSPAEAQGLLGGSLEMTLNGQPVLLGGDIITGVNGAPILNPEALAKTLGDLKVGARLRLAISREGKSLEVEVVLTERPLLPADLPWRRSEGAGRTANRTGAPARGPMRSFVF